MAHDGVVELTINREQIRGPRNLGQGGRAPPALRIFSMKANIKKIGAALLAVGLCAWCTDARAQTTTTVTTTTGAFAQFVPGSETLVVRTDANPSPVRYVVTGQTNFVDETGAPVAIDRIAPGSPLSVQYTTTGDQLVASRVVVQVQKPVVATAPNVVEQRATTTTTTTRPLTHEEREAVKEQRKDRREQAKKEIEERKKALEKAEDALDDDGDGD